VNREAIQKLFDHLDFVWPQIVQIISRAGGDDVLKRAAPGSGWPNLRNCLAHLLFAYDSWLSRMTGVPRTNIGEIVQTLAEIDAEHASFRSKYDSLLASLSDTELMEIRTFDFGEGEKMPYSYSELITHVALHERGHHGDIITLFSQLGIGDDPAFDYRHHLRRMPL
jgi:uncharacterized damage-inducible protein DinB